jgi:ABC-2 type transport system ATP-binding protein
MSSGRLVFQGPLTELRRTRATRIRVETTEPARAAQVLRRLHLTSPLITGNNISAQLEGQQPEQICAELAAAGIAVRGLGVVTPSLEELFMALTGEGFNIND